MEPSCRRTKTKLETSGLSTLKSILFKYYMTSLKTSYDVYDPRSYKTICLKCKARFTLVVRVGDFSCWRMWISALKTIAQEK